MVSLYPIPTATPRGAVTTREAKDDTRPGAHTAPVMRYRPVAETPSEPMRNRGIQWRHVGDIDLIQPCVITKRAERERRRSFVGRPAELLAGVGPESHRQVLLGSREMAVHGRRRDLQNAADLLDGKAVEVTKL